MRERPLPEEPGRQRVRRVRPRPVFGLRGRFVLHGMRTRYLAASSRRDVVPQMREGNYSNAGAKACTSCAAGQHQPVPGRPTCLLCPPGLYEGTTGSGANTCRFAHPHGVVRGACARCSKHDRRLCLFRIAHSTSISLTHNTKRQHVYEMHKDLIQSHHPFAICPSSLCVASSCAEGKFQFSAGQAFYTPCSGMST